MRAILEMSVGSPDYEKRAVFLLGQRYAIGDLPERF
jgi:hypothetical protein